MSDSIRPDPERDAKVAAMRRLIEEAEKSGVSPSTMDDILVAARREVSDGTQRPS